VRGSLGFTLVNDEVQCLQPWSVGLCSTVQSEGVIRLVMAFLRRFFVEAKNFELSVGEGASVLRLEEKRKGLSNVLYVWVCWALGGWLPRWRIWWLNLVRKFS
jgi:hypothetical protein